jgi:lipid-A-disaccharide synthase
MKVILVTGEVSGDKHGAFLAEALARIEPGIAIYGIGGRMMESAGVRVFADISGLNAFQYRYLPRLLFRNRLNRIVCEYREFLERERPDIAVLIGLADDTTYVAMRIAQVTRDAGVPVFYYFAPHVWMWSGRKTNRVARQFDRILTVFPQEEAAYREAGSKTVFVGHPIIDEIQSGAGGVKGPPLKRDGEKAVVFFPGSRKGELRYHLPIMRRIIREIDNTYRSPDMKIVYLVSALNDRFKERIENYLGGQSGVRVIKGMVYDLMECADAVVTSSGTITLEIALHEKPGVIIYRVPWITYLIGRTLLGFRYIGMPNVIMERKIVPEFLQGAIDPKRIGEIVKTILENTEQACEMRRDLKRLKERLGGSGALNRAAGAIVEYVRQKE